MSEVKKTSFYKAESKQKLKKFLLEELKIIETMDYKDAIHGSYKFFSTSKPLKTQLAHLKTGVLTAIYYTKTVKRQDGGVLSLQHEWVYLESDKKRKKINDGLKTTMQEFKQHGED